MCTWLSVTVAKRVEEFDRNALEVMGSHTHSGDSVRLIPRADKFPAQRLNCNVRGDNRQKVVADYQDKFILSDKIT